MLPISSAPGKPKLKSPDDSELGFTVCSVEVQGGFRVLPKMHTAQQGITLRSMTHNLAFFVPREIVPV